MNYKENPSQKQTKKKKHKRMKINTIEQLLKFCEKDCQIGVFDINADFRYNFFDNVKSLIVDNRINFYLPKRLSDLEIGYIGLNEYMEEVPNWIHQFNQFSKIKLLV